VGAKDVSRGMKVAYHSAVFLFRTVLSYVTPGSTVGETGSRRTCRRWHLFPPQHCCLLHSITARGTAILNSVFLSRYMPPAVWSYMHVRSYSSRTLKLADCFTARYVSEKCQFQNTSTTRTLADNPQRVIYVISISEHIVVAKSYTLANRIPTPSCPSSSPATS
jgi:hypothetical protein